MATYPNFYENLNEALMRLRGTIVMYDNDPYHVWTICNHKKDNIFRIYLSPVEQYNPQLNIPALSNWPHGDNHMGTEIDKFMEETAEKIKLTLLRKQMNSPLFNRFRPFPLGMLNMEGYAVYTERKPNRKTEQGLIPSMIESKRIQYAFHTEPYKFNLYSLEFRDCIKGDYPTPNECLSGFKAGYMNESIAFHRHFALVKGPIDTMFLAYKKDIVAYLPDGNYSNVIISKKYLHTKEVISDLNLFENIEIQEKGNAF